MLLLTDTIYIAGKITGLTDYKKKFDEMEKQLNEHGFRKILKPTCLPGNLEYEQYMTICFSMIDASDAVCFLDDWKDSPGARLELHYARSKKKKIVFPGNIKRND